MPKRQGGRCEYANGQSHGRRIPSANIRSFDARGARRRKTHSRCRRAPRAAWTLPRLRKRPAVCLILEASGSLRCLWSAVWAYSLRRCSSLAHDSGCRPSRCTNCPCSRKSNISAELGFYGLMAGGGYVRGAGCSATGQRTTSKRDLEHAVTGIGARLSNSWQLCRFDRDGR